MSDQKLQNIFGKIGAAKTLGSQYANRLGAGNHRVAIKRFAVKESSKGMGTILEADFVVLRSTSLPVGETRGWAWFINAPGPFAGQYEEARAKEFLTAVGGCLEDNSDVADIGTTLAGPGQPGRGLVIDVQISLQTNRDGSPKANAKGDQYTTAKWIPVKQTLEDLAKMRDTVDANDSGQAITADSATVATGAVVHADPVAQQPVKTGFGLLKNVK